MARTCAAALVLVLTLPSLVSAFYLPGGAPKDYLEGQKVPVHVNRLNPMMNAVDSKIVSIASQPACPFDYTFYTRSHYLSVIT